MRIRILLLLIFITQSFLISAQSSDKKTIDQKEKERLENEFKALGDYYIDDSGLVVYKASSTAIIKNNGSANDNKIVNEPKKTNNPVVVSKPPQKQEVKNNEYQQERKSTTVKSQNDVAKQPMKEETRRHYDEDKDIPVVERNSSLKTKEPVVEHEVVIIDQASKQKLKNEAVDASKKQQTANTTTAPEVVVPEPKKKASTSEGGSILNRKRKSQYKNMEEAALAVEALIQDLKKEQATYSNSSSMSSRLSRGVTKDLRRQSEANVQQNTSDSNNNTLYEVKSIEDSSDFGNEPSYFINGVQVDKNQINRLRKADIINREIRVRNTVTGNPNGEIWYDVKPDAIMQP